MRRCDRPVPSWKVMVVEEHYCVEELALRLSKRLRRSCLSRWEVITWIVSCGGFPFQKRSSVVGF